VNKSRLSILKNKDGKYLKDKNEGVYVYHVGTPHLFVQATGYLKYVHGKSAQETIFYRGQEKLHRGSLRPSLYRSIEGDAGQSKMNGLLNEHISMTLKDAQALKDVDKDVREPLLQHYGIRTRWIDMVDNMWVALWFACHKVRSAGKANEYLHFEQRKPKTGQYAYVLLLKTDWNPVQGKPGLYAGSLTKTIDLRIAAPSTFVRPHAQHALLARLRPSNKDCSLDYRSMVAGIIRVSLEDALNWLGNGTLLTPHVLFPSPVYDWGYRDLLHLPDSASVHLGTIQHVSP
jgi:hypothetical protein